MGQPRRPTTPPARDSQDGPLPVRGSGRPQGSPSLAPPSASNLTYDIYAEANTPNIGVPLPSTLPALPLASRPLAPGAERGRGICVIVECGRVVHGRAFCAQHYNAWQRYGHPLAYSRRGRILWGPRPLGCSVKGCAREYRARGFCRLHYDRWRRHGDALWLPGPRKGHPLGGAGQDRLRAWIHDHPNPCLTYTLQEIGDQLGVSRERVRQLVPKVTGQKWQKRWPNKANLILAAFLEEHPEGMLTKARGGLLLKEIAAALDLAPSTVGKVWRRLGLPPRSLQAISDAEAHERHYHRVLRTETCISCGIEFPWTGLKEQQHKHYGCRIVCSRLCGRRAAKREREMRDA